MCVKNGGYLGTSFIFPIPRRGCTACWKDSVVAEVTGSLSLSVAATEMQVLAVPWAMNNCGCYGFNR